MVGSLILALAIASLCLCPPLNEFPPVPNLVSYPSGKAAMKSCIIAILQASTTSNLVTSQGRFLAPVPAPAPAPARPMATLSCILISNKIHPCWTAAICSLVYSLSRYAIDWSSNVISPPTGVYIRKSNCATVDFPDPDPPTMNVVSPGGRNKVTSLRTHCSGLEG